MGQKEIYVKLVKVWGGFKVGDVVRFGEVKGQERVRLCEGIEVKKQKCVNEPKVETATNMPAAVTKEKIAADAKAKADAEAKAREDAATTANLELGPLSDDEKDFLADLLKEHTAKSGPNEGKLKVNTPQDVVTEINNLEIRAELPDKDAQARAEAERVDSPNLSAEENQELRDLWDECIIKSGKHAGEFHLEAPELKVTRIKELSVKADEGDE